MSLPSQTWSAADHRNAGLMLTACSLVGVVGLSPKPAESSHDASTELTSSTIVARVNQQPIRHAEVRDELKRWTSHETSNATDTTNLRATVLEYLIRRELVRQYVSRDGRGASQQDVEFRLEQERRRLASQDVELADYLSQRGLDVEALRRRIAWQLGWPRYLQRYSDEKYLRKQFESRPRDYDGTRLRVAHILLRVPQPNRPSDVQSTLGDATKRAQEIRRQIEAGEVTFADAARKYSDAPTADQGGGLGLISRRQPMPEAFSRAAFTLQPNGTSDPVVTRFGVHLIRCLEVEPGQRGWQDVRDQLRKDLARRVFDTLVKHERPRARVEYTGAMPYIEPKSGRLAGAEE